MSLVPEYLKTQYNSIIKQAKACIHRHRPSTICEALSALANNVEQSDLKDSYGSGGVIENFENELCELFNKPSCLFLPTGTLAQCVAMKCYSETSARQDIGLHATSHLLLHEHMAIETLWGLSTVTMGKHKHVSSAGDLTAVNPHTTAAIIIELPMREIGGALPEWDELLAIHNWCTNHNVKLHLDGARVWQTGHFYQRTMADIATIFDSLYVSFYKDLNGVFGAALLGEANFIEQARIWARRAGGNPPTLYPEVIAARVGLKTYLPKMSDYVQFTAVLCNKLKDVNVQITPASPKAAMFHMLCHYSAAVLAEKIVAYAQKHNVVPLPLPRWGDDNTCLCEITIGDNALTQSPDFWVKHIQACLEN